LPLEATRPQRCSKHCTLTPAPSVTRLRRSPALAEGRAGDPPPYTPQAMRVVELAVREPLRAGAYEIRGVHILIGLIAECEGVAAQVLAKMGADLNRVRRPVR
jgi:hypothetical protein